jgi:hypothetical protein
MHIHLINFQVMRVFELKIHTTPSNYPCTYYELDYVSKTLDWASKKDKKTSNIKEKVYKTIKTNSKKKASITIDYDFLCDHI